MKRSTILAITIVLGLTLIVLLVKLFFPSSSTNITKTVLTGKEWLNTEFGKDRVELKGKNSLVFFWNASDVNSRKMIKIVNEWNTRYAGLLQITGIHCPEFDFEKEKKNIVKLVEDLNIKWPLVLDNENTLRKMFMNDELPALYLLNYKGKTVYFHKGPGDYETAEAALQAAISQLNPKALLPELEKPEITGVCFMVTPDLYCGYRKGAIVNKGGFFTEKSHDYKGNINLPADTMALRGRFKVFKEYIETDGSGAEVLLNFTATEVNIVAETIPPGEACLELLFNGQPLTKEIKGENVDENYQVKLKFPGMYQLLKNRKKAEKGILSVKAVKGKFRLYAFRFYGCSE